MVAQPKLFKPYRAKHIIGCRQFFRVAGGQSPDYKPFHEALHRLYDESSFQLSGNDNTPVFSSEVWQRLMQWLHRHKEYKPELLTQPEARAAIEETNRILSQPLSDISISQEIPPELTAQLEKDFFIFSGFKTHHELREASKLLKDDNGNFKPFQRFLKDVETIDNTYNRHYLRAEYNYATASVQMAVKWKEWEQDGDAYNLQYRTAGDHRVRREHAALNGITLPPSDPFWDNFLPPNGWNCRCTTVQVRKEKYKVSDSKKAIEAGNACTAKPKQQIFRFNPGKVGKVFPPKHPYLPKGCGNCNFKQLSYDPNNETCIACKAIDRCRERANLLIKETIKTYKNGGKIESYKIIDKTTADYNRILAVAKFFAKRGETVLIAPKFDSPKNCPGYDAIYRALKGTKYYGKCPDLKIGDKWYEHESFIGENPKRSFSNMCNRGLKQSDRIIIEDCGLTDAYVKRVLSNRLKEGHQITEVWIMGREAPIYKKSEE